MKILQTDLEVLNRKGITEETLAEQLESLKNGFPYLKIEAPATIGNGITLPSEELMARSIEIWHEFLAAGGTVEKLVPASGAASRMFKNLFAFVDGKKDRPADDFMKKFFEGIFDFAFFPLLNSACMRLYGKSVDSLIAEHRYKDVVKALIGSEGLNYGNLPKALLEFHRACGDTRTALAEHLAEGAQYAVDRHGKVHVHFTVSEDHIPAVEAKLEEIRGRMERERGVKFEISLSVQKPSTDTVAANPDGTPYRENGELFFRPGGHGALIENLGDLDADVIFIKNIDNVVPDALREPTVKYKKVIGGILVATKQRADEYCARLDKGTPSDEELAEMLTFLREVLCVTDSCVDTLPAEAKAVYLMQKLNRPMRVCGMVKNEGEPGGGPFLAYSADGTVQPQILESTQLNPKEEKKLLKDASHFNPVDLVCSIRNWKGEKFNLRDFVDKSTGFISSKSREGHEIKALELPGLWNGAMSDWNTIFVEVAPETFNPVKTVNDLLRPSHQPS